MIEDIESGSSYDTLSLRDLLQAREAYHVHLMNKPNVVATAIGRYRIRSSDPWPTVNADDDRLVFPDAPSGNEERTLSNSEIRFYSWPAVLVFVSEWIDKSEFGTRSHPDQMVPRTLFLPDGRKVPVCVISARRNEGARRPSKPFNFTRSLYGGGYSVVTHVQNDEHYGSIACLVTDGHKCYALTNTHVAGEPKDQVYARINGDEDRIGLAAAKQVSYRPFRGIYPSLPGEDTFVRMDAGLIDVDDLHMWTAQVYGIGELGRTVDLSEHNLCLRVIGQPVRAFGCASGELHGQIDALFYRYRSMGGSEYVSDMLIGPRKDKTLDTMPGDSGTLWVLDDGALPGGDECKPEDHNRPVAVQWGGQVLGGESSHEHSYALATCISTVCQLLDVDVVRSWNIGYPEYWGMQPHLSIASLAMLAVRDPKLRTLLGNCTCYIAGDPSKIEAMNQNKVWDNVKNRGMLIPLSVSPDFPWRASLAAYDKGATDEGPNHYIDIDEDGRENALRLFGDKTIAAWLPYLDRDIGRLPFRVCQVFDMLRHAPSVTSFVFLAGVMAHYVADSCQPLHLSMYSRGYPGKIDTKLHSEIDNIVKGEMWTSVCERVRAKISQHAGDSTSEITSPNEAFAEVVRLMEGTYKAIDPKAIVDYYYGCAGGPDKKAKAVWERYQVEVVGAFVDGCITLARLWESAWTEELAEADWSEVTVDSLDRLYRTKGLLTSPTREGMAALAG